MSVKNLNLSDKFLDYHLDQILKASGSALKFYDKGYLSHEKMKAALREAIEKANEKA